jgi:hypothetical protein
MSAKRFDGLGGFAKNSSDIPLSGWLGGALVVALLFALAYAGSWAGLQ